MATDWTIIAATILAPVLAVQAQKWVEISRETGRRREMLFATLMTTRADRLSSEHVRALNMIDLAFYGRRILGFRWQSRACKAVITSWNAYLDHLSKDHRNFTDTDWVGHNKQSITLFVALLEAMGAERNTHFDWAQISFGVYQPGIVGRNQEEQAKFKEALFEILDGKRAIPVSVSVPKDGTS